ncbi:DUF2809 domain-containing protein [uncultured Microbacterium sp.]|uniref:ribosomal maturation YjgA family protein n=1 Tax=uncultured Microbacterium sp. TaxID=191216 RepID=UPI0025E64429|nr:DUF2809 domain-containing protein [uncultured Microbacterium sp.]
MPPRRRRLIALLALAVVVAAGLVVHLALPSSDAADIAGDALYTVAVYGGLVVVFPRLRPLVVALVAGGWSLGVELFQATGVPADLAERFRPIALVLGTGFDPRDLVVSACAAAVVGMTDAATGRALRGETTRPEAPPRGTSA